jgi:hypothetical protein
MYALPDLAVTGEIIPAAWGNQNRSNWAESVPAKATTAGQIPYATGAGVIAMLAAVAAGQVLTSQGVGVAPAWGSVPAAAFPSVKRCRVYKAAAQSVTNGDPLTWDSETYDPPGWHSAGTNPTRITVDVTGVYLVHAQVVLVSGGGVFRGVDLLKNGATACGHGVLTPAATNNPAVSAMNVVEATAGDYFTAQAGHDAGGTLNTVANQDWTFFEVVYLGPQ